MLRVCLSALAFGFLKSGGGEKKFGGVVVAKRYDCLVTRSTSVFLLFLISFQSRAMVTSGGTIEDRRSHLRRMAAGGRESILTNNASAVVAAAATQGSGGSGSVGESRMASGGHGVAGEGRMAGGGGGSGGASRGTMDASVASHITQDTANPLAGMGQVPMMFHGKEGVGGGVAVVVADWLRSLIVHRFLCLPCLSSRWRRWNAF